MQDVANVVEQRVNVLEGEGPALLTIARSSTAMKLDYHLSCANLSNMDVALLGTMQQVETHNDLWL